jgi:hypothetical protein
MRVRRKRCLYCGRYFRPDYRVGTKQKSCGRDDCRHSCKSEAQERWVNKNQGYFCGRYENTKEWRCEHDDYQRKWRAQHRGG